jgi:hypothetical protein
LLAATGLRIGEAVAIKWADIEGGVLTVSRRIYHGGLDTLKSKRAARRLPLSAELIERIRVLGENHEWVFRSLADRPLSPENALKRYVRPVVEELGIKLGGWHDFRHTLSTTLRRNGVHPKVVSDILGHSKVNLAMDVYDRTTVEDFASPLASVSSHLLLDVAESSANSPKATETTEQSRTGRALTNQDVSDMLANGISAEIVAAKIGRSPNSFDTSPDALTALKKLGVADSIILAMVKAS